MEEWDRHFRRLLGGVEWMVIRGRGRNEERGEERGIERKEAGTNPVEKTSHLLKLSTNRSNFLLLHKTGSASQPGHVPLIETSDSQREQHLKNTAGGYNFLFQRFQLDGNTQPGEYHHRAQSAALRRHLEITLQMLE
ncbi:uncharacterized protein LOC112589103 [Harpegnathos saltator]|uniref:uncharacterized protein LOC112589103 n=1 Tax=Harpegnathos saltator TaxID=610380 RepID=UPI000DBEE704|nr:uncharacterized protein LOC112589103 [Harpegnathos saltator]